MPEPWKKFAERMSPLNFLPRVSAVLVFRNGRDGTALWQRQSLCRYRCSCGNLCNKLWRCVADMDCGRVHLLGGLWLHEKMGPRETETRLGNQGGRRHNNPSNSRSADVAKETP